MKKYWIILSIIGLFAGYSLCGFAIETKVEEPTEAVDQEVNLAKGSQAAILFETSSNMVLFDKEKDRRLPPASMTKIMTLLLIYEALEANQITKTTMLTIGEEPTKVEGSKAFLSIGDEISVDELLKCICIASANDAAIALAIHLAGSEEEFVKKMNEKVNTLGLKNTHFSDCTGLSSKNHYTSAYDLAILSDELIDRFPDVLTYTNVKEDYIRKDSPKPFWLVNTNKMIGRVKYLDGLKTGYTSFSGYCITLHMKQDNMGLITVVFGYDKPTTRNAESLELLRYGYANYRLEKVLAKDTVVDSIDHILYKNRINIKVEEDVYHLTKKADKFSYDIKYNYELNANKCEGEAYIYLNDKLLKKGKLGTQDEIKKKNFIELWFSIFKETFI